MDMDMELSEQVHIHMTESIWSSTSQHCQRQQGFTLVNREGSRKLEFDAEMEAYLAAFSLDLLLELDDPFYMDKPCQKRVRLVLNVCATLTAPLLFGHTYFDFDFSGTNSRGAVSH